MEFVLGSAASTVKNGNLLLICSGHPVGGARVDVLAAAFLPMVRINRMM